MAPSKTDLEQLVNAFRHSWLNSSRCIEFLESDVVRRQNAVVLGPNADEDSRGWRRDQSPLKLSDLARMVSGSFRETATTEFLTISFGCALLGELLVTVHTSQPGTILRVSADGMRGSVQAPFEPLRNTLCHPGMLPEGPESDAESSSFVALINLLKRRYTDQQPLIQKLENSRHAIAGFEMAQWCLARIHELGQFEIVQAVLDDLRRRKIVVTHNDEVRIAKSRRFKRELEELLDQYPRTKSASDLLKQNVTASSSGLPQPRPCRSGPRAPRRLHLKRRGP